MDKALEKAAAWRDELNRTIAMLQGQLRDTQAELDRRQTALTRVEGFIAEWHRFAESDLPKLVQTPEASPTPPPPPPIQVADAEPPKKRKATGNSKKEEVGAEARRILAERDGPLSRTDLYQMLIARGLKIDGTDPEMVLSTMLWRVGDKCGVVRLASGGYDLKERQGALEEARIDAENRAVDEMLDEAAE